MKFEEFKTKYADIDANIIADIQKLVQGETDSVRTEYSQKIKDLEQYKPQEKSETEIALEKAQNELANYKFMETCKSKGINADLAQYLKSDADLDAVLKVIPTKSADFVPNGVNTTGACGISRADFKKMTYTEKAKLYTESPELYASLKD